MSDGLSARGMARSRAAGRRQVRRLVARAKVERQKEKALAEMRRFTALAATFKIEER